MRTQIFFIASLNLFAFVLTENNAQKPKNIVIIMADDLGFNDVSYRGSNEVPTYNIDALAYGGIILDRFYTPAMCTPSRAALLTGKYPHHIGMQDFVVVSDEPFGLGLDQKIMPQYFKEVGYKTHLIGKWHQGFFQQQYWPTKRGFDSFFGYLGPYIGYHDHSLIMTGRNYSRGYDLRRNLEVDRSYGDLYVTDMFTKEAINVIQNHDDNEPLFLLVNHLAPHSGNDDIPLEAKPEDYEKFSYIENEDRRTLAAMIYSLDESVGEIVEALTNRGIMNDTIIVFYSDNGGPSAFLHATTASNYPLRSQKESGFEGGIRTAAFIYAPWLPSGVIRRDFFYVADCLPTLSTLANANIKINTSLDGIDLSNMITKGISPFRDEVMTLDDGTGYSSLILNGFKYLNGSSSNGMADGWLGSNNNSDIHNEKYLDGVLNSKAAKLLNIKLNPENIQKLREDAKVKCTGVKIECDLLKAPCLFDIINDPCEENNLNQAETHKSAIETITNEFNERLKKVVPSRRKKSDPRCDPANFNNTWHFWQPDSDKDVDPNGTGKVQKKSRFLAFISIAVGLAIAFRR